MRGYLQISAQKEKARLIASGRYAASLDPTSASEVYDEESEALIQQTLVRLGENPDREGLHRTPLRVANAMNFLTSGTEMLE